MALGTAAFGYALHVQEGAPDQILPEVGDLPEGTELAEIGELGAIALSTAQVGSVSVLIRGYIQPFEAIWRYLGIFRGSFRIIRAALGSHNSAVINWSVWNNCHIP